MSLWREFWKDFRNHYRQARQMREDKKNQPTINLTTGNQYHKCIECGDQVTRITLDGLNLPCRHYAGTITRKNTQ